MNEIQFGTCEVCGKKKSLITNYPKDGSGPIRVCADCLIEICKAERAEAENDNEK